MQSRCGVRLAVPAHAARARRKGRRGVRNHPRPHLLTCGNVADGGCWQLPYRQAKAAGNDLAGWALAGAEAEVRPEAR